MTYTELRCRILPGARLIYDLDLKGDQGRH